MMLLYVTMMGMDAYAQDEKSDNELLDSIMKNDPLFRSFDSLNNPVSYGLVSITFGNKLFSNRNNQVNASQEDNKFVVTPAVGYYHKSGFGINFAANLLTENGKTGFYQYSLTPSYDLTTNKNFDAGISYTRYFVKSEYSLSVSPLENDLYGYLILKKNWLVPGIVIGYATGSFKEMINVDTTIGIVRIHYTDTVTTSIKSISLSGSVEHRFSFFDIIFPKDGLSLKPQLLLTAGTNTYKETHRGATIFQNRGTRRNTRVTRFNEESEKSGFKFQSVAFALSADYLIGNLNIRPNIYLDYYLPETTGKRFASLFSIGICYTML